MKHVMTAALTVVLGAGAAFAQEERDRRLDDLQREFERSMKGLQQKFEEERGRLEKEFRAAREKLTRPAPGERRAEPDKPDKRGEPGPGRRPEPRGGMEEMLQRLMERVEQLEKRLDREMPRLRELPKTLPRGFQFKDLDEWKEFLPRDLETYRDLLRRRFKDEEFDFKKAPEKKEKEEKFEFQFRKAPPKKDDKHDDKKEEKSEKKKADKEQF